MSIPKVSVIIPVYNTEQYLEAAISSIQNQTLKDIEILVINDGSTDKSLVIAENLFHSDKRISIFNQFNQGQSVARNLGMENASGEYLYFMDSDDLLENEALEKCYNMCVSQNLDLLFFDADVFRDDIKAIHGFNYHRSGEIAEIIYSGVDILETLLMKNLFRASPCLFFVRRQLVEIAKLSFYPGIIHEDELFTPLLYIASERVGFIPCAFFHRRIRANSTMTKNFSQRNIRGYFCVIEQLNLLYVQSDNRVKAIIDQLTRNIVNAVAYQAGSLPLNERMSVFYYFLTKGIIKFASLKNVIILFFPITITIKSKILRPVLKKINIDY